MNRGPACSHCRKRVLGAGDIQYHVNYVLLFGVARRVCLAAVGYAPCDHHLCACHVAVARCNRCHVFCERVEVLGESAIFLANWNPGNDRCRGTDNSAWNHGNVRGRFSNVGAGAERVGASRSDQSRKMVSSVFVREDCADDVLHVYPCTTVRIDYQDEIVDAG